MKIAIIAHSHYPIREPFAGGLEVHTSHLTRQLQGSGHHITLFSAKGTDETLPFVPFFQPTAAELFQPYHTINRYREQRYLALMEELKCQNFDIVHNNSLHYIPLEKVSSLPAPMVTILHTPPFPSLATGFKASLGASNHHVISVSKAVTRAWQRVIPGLKTSLVYNGVDIQCWQPTKQLRKGAIWCGRITPEKGTHLAIQAAILANVPLKICGPIHNPEYFDQEVKPLLNSSENVTYLGCLNAAVLAKEVAQASVFVCTPCWDEPFGLVAAEAIACGTPVAGFKRGALDEILTSETGVLVNESIDALAIAILQAQHLNRRACRHRATELFSMESMIRQYVEQYQSLIQTHRHRPALQPAS